VDMLIKYGSNLNEKCLFGTPLHAGIIFFQILNYSHYLNFYKATLLGHTDTADLLIKNGSKIAPMSSYLLKIGNS